MKKVIEYGVWKDVPPDSELLDGSEDDTDKFIQFCRETAKEALKGASDERNEKNSGAVGNP